jgi:hypothetical protein
MLILNMDLNFVFVCNPEKLQCDSPNYPPIHALTLNMIGTKECLVLYKPSIFFNFFLND